MFDEDDGHRINLEWVLILIFFFFLFWKKFKLVAKF